MKWYGGNIAEAVQRSKQEGAVFFVAIFGEDEQSKKLEETVTCGEIQAILSTKQYVCIRLKAESPEHLQFKQIYTNAQSPCLYFISLMGAPVEIVHGETSVADLKGTCKSAWSKHAKVAQCQKAPVAKPKRGKSSDRDQSSSSSATAEAAQVSGSSVEEAEMTPTIAELESEASNANLTLEQKIERARLLAAAKAQLKLKEEADEARRREKERREAGKGMAEMKRWQDEQEAKKLVEERKRDKLEEQLLRQKIRDQIAQDRAERNMRSNASYAYDGAEGPGPSTSAGTSPKPTAFSSSVPADYSGKARLQFRMPDGSSQTHTFEKDVTLGHVHRFLIDGQHVTFSKFSLCVAYPRREFTTAEYVNSLMELGLLPSAALLVIPGSGGSVRGAADGTGLWVWITTFLGYLLYPVTFLFGLMPQALPAPSSSRGNSQPASSSRPNQAENRLGGSAPPPGTSPWGGGADRSGQAGAGPSTSADVRKRNVDRKPDGNIHRLQNQESDSEEDQGTWNGNSTQQKPR